MLDDIGRSWAEQDSSIHNRIINSQHEPRPHDDWCSPFPHVSLRESTRKGGCIARYGLGRQHIQRYERDELGNEKQHVRMLGVILLENLIREHKGGPET